MSRDQIAKRKLFIGRHIGFSLPLITRRFGAELGDGVAEYLYRQILLPVNFKMTVRDHIEILYGR
jgi:hypothetical protein